MNINTIDAWLMLGLVILCWGPWWGAFAAFTITAVLIWTEFMR